MKEITMDNIRCYKLTNGVEVIANEQEQFSNDYFRLENAMFLDLVQLEGGKHDVNFYPLTLCAKLDPDATHFGMNFDLQKNLVMVSYTPRPEIEARYRQFISPILLINK